MPSTRLAGAGAPIGKPIPITEDRAGYDALLAALGTLLLDPGVGLAAGWLAEGARRLLRPTPRPADEA
ncbi:hypothetical protein GCM10009416_34540 [Craurococcus roseus]|uniref:Uncharacterized protein n=1 Tax=Craurococcus roseus TaxID=77585 RepID=A0ABN1FLE3_9PROT